MSEESTFALANGVIVDRQTGQVISPSASADAVEKQSRREKRAQEMGRDRSNRAIRISIGELPADPRAITTVGIVWLYYTLGLSDFDIRDATGLTLQQIESIKGYSLFGTIEQHVLNNLTKLGEENIIARLASLAPRAVDELEDILEDGEVDVNARTRVIENILDRAGFSAKQIVEHKHKVEGGLTIRYIEDVQTDSKNIPRINIDRNGAIDA